MSKVDSIILAVNQLNSNVKIIPYYMALDSSNALEIIEKYDVILDASDNVATRYLLNDACVLAKKPLVSGSALRFDGQLTVYNYKIVLMTMSNKKQNNNNSKIKPVSQKK